MLSHHSEKTRVDPNFNILPFMDDTRTRGNLRHSDNFTALWLNHNQILGGHRCEVWLGPIGRGRVPFILVGVIAGDMVDSLGKVSAGNAADANNASGYRGVPAMIIESRQEALNDGTADETTRGPCPSSMCIRE